MSRAQELWNKIEAEQAAYKAKLLALAPQDILTLAYDYAVREDIVCALSDMELDEDEELVDALLSLPNPLAEICSYYRTLATNITEYVQTAISDVANKAAEGWWKCTDDDCAQYVRPLDLTPGYHAHKKWECIQVFGSEKSGYGIACAVVDLSSIDMNELDGIIRSYYSGGMAFVRDMCSNGEWSVNEYQIYAECVFETLYGMDGETNYSSYEEAEAAVKEYIKNN